MESIFEVVDYTGETYYPLGIFRTFEQAIYGIQNIESTDSAISEWTTENYERLVIIERKIGWSGNGKHVAEVEREEYYDEENDEYKWKRK